MTSIEIWISNNQFACHYPRSKTKYYCFYISQTESRLSLFGFYLLPTILSKFWDKNSL